MKKKRNKKHNSIIFTKLNLNIAMSLMTLGFIIPLIEQITNPSPKQNFWQKYFDTPINEEEQNILERLLLSMSFYNGNFLRQIGLASLLSFCFSLLDPVLEYVSERLPKLPNGRAVLYQDHQFFNLQSDLLMTGLIAPMIEELEYRHVKPIITSSVLDLLINNYPLSQFLAIVLCSLDFAMAHKPTSFIWKWHCMNYALMQNMLYLSNNRCITASFLAHILPNTLAVIGHYANCNQVKTKGAEGFATRHCGLFSHKTTVFSEETVTVEQMSQCAFGMGSHTAQAAFLKR